MPKCRNIKLVFMAALLWLGCSACLGPQIDVPPQPRPPGWNIDSVTFSPKGDDILFRLNANKVGIRCGLYLMDSKGKVKRQYFVDPGEFWRVRAAFTPDGEKVAFVIDTGDEPRNIFIMDKDGGNLRRLTTGQYQDDFPHFTPDGKRLYFMRQQKRPNDREYLRHNSICYVDMATEETVTAAEIKMKYHIGYMAPMSDWQYLFIDTKDTGYGSLLDLGHLFWKMSMRDPQKMWPIEPDLAPVVKVPLPRRKQTLDIEHYHHPDGTVFSVRDMPYGKKEVAYLEFDEPWVSMDGNWLAFAWRPFGKRDYQGDYIDDMLFLTDLRTMKTIRVKSPGSMALPEAVNADGTKVLFNTWTGPGLASDNELRPCIYDRTTGKIHKFPLDFTQCATPPKLTGLPK